MFLALLESNAFKDIGILAAIPMSDKDAASCSQQPIASKEFENMTTRTTTVLIALPCYSVDIGDCLCRALAQRACLAVISLK